MVDVIREESLYEHTGGRPLSLEELSSRYQRLAVGRSADGEQAWLNWIIRLRDGDVAVGTVQATITGAAAQIAWVVGVPWQRRGVATEAAAALVVWLEGRGVQEISANIHPRHVASQRVASRAGLAPTREVLDGEQVWRRSHRGEQAR